MTTTESGAKPDTFARTIVNVGLLLVPVGVICAMFVNAFGVYFVIGGSAQVTDSATVTYRVLATIAICVPLLGAIVASVTKRSGFVAAQVILLSLALVASFLFAVPRASDSQPERHPYMPGDYTPCYSGSSNPCPGG